MGDYSSKKPILRIERNGRPNTFSPDAIFDWNAEDTASTLSECWPKDWLPLDFPRARISAINYDTDPHLWGPLWRSKRSRLDLVQRADEMIKLLVEHRIGVNRPIVWIGHSKGGLYVKQIIVNALANNSAKTDPLWESTRSILFYSVPHRGSPLANLNLPFLKQSIEMIEIRRSTRERGRCTVIVINQIIPPDFPHIIKLHEAFVKLCTDGTLDVDVFSFLELKETKLSVFYLRIIDFISGGNQPRVGSLCSRFQIARFHFRSRDRRPLRPAVGPFQRVQAAASELHSVQATRQHDQQSAGTEQNY